MKIPSNLLSRRHLLLVALLGYVLLAQAIPAWGEYYARHLYPFIGRILSTLSMPIPFAVGDLFIAASLAWVVGYPLYALFRLKGQRRRALLRVAEYLLWIYAWFYLAWGLNYSQQGFFQRTGIKPVAYSEARFRQFAETYIDRLNDSYVPIEQIDRQVVADEVASAYRQLAGVMAIHPPFQKRPRAKTMLFTPLISMVGVTGSMGPFFCEFTLNGDLLPSQYPATYAHELSHLTGITSEAEANFYAYQACTLSGVPAIRFSGYFSVFGYVLSNAFRLLDEEEYTKLTQRVRPEVIDLYRQNRKYWEEKYSPLVGDVQDWIYDLYLKGNKIASGRKNYSEVVALLISYEELMHEVLTSKNRQD